MVFGWRERGGEWLFAFKKCADDCLRVQLEATDRAALRSVDLEDLRAFAVSNRES